MAAKLLSLLWGQTRSSQKAPQPPGEGLFGEELPPTEGEGRLCLAFCRKILIAPTGQLVVPTGSLQEAL